MFLFVCVDTLHPSQQFFSHVGMFSPSSCVGPVLSRGYCLAQGHYTFPLVKVKCTVELSKVLFSKDDQYQSQ